MSNVLPRTSQRKLQFENGTAIGMSHRWVGGQYCSILTAAGIVGCGIYDIDTPSEFDQAIAIAKGTPANPLVEPEDLFEAKIVDCTPKAKTYGIDVGMTGRQAVELMLRAVPPVESTPLTELEVKMPAVKATPICVKHIDHVTLVVKDMEQSREFYVDLLGMDEVPRPAFGFPGLWFQAGATQIHLIEEHEESGPARIFVPEKCQISRTRHFAFEVEDALATVESLKEQGIPIVAGPKNRPDGPIQLYINDPDGNLVELFSFA